MMILRDNLPSIESTETYHQYKNVFKKAFNINKCNIHKAFYAINL